MSEKMALCMRFGVLWRAIRYCLMAFRTFILVCFETMFLAAFRAVLPMVARVLIHSGIKCVIGGGLGELGGSLFKMGCNLQLASCCVIYIAFRML